MNSVSRTQKPRAGFTLLEVMVVIVILGVLASLVVPNLLGNKEKADRQKAITGRFYPAGSDGGDCYSWRPGKSGGA